MTGRRAFCRTCRDAVAAQPGECRDKAEGVPDRAQRARRGGPMERLIQGAPPLERLMQAGRDVADERLRVHGPDRNAAQQRILDILAQQQVGVSPKGGQRPV